MARVDVHNKIYASRFCLNLLGLYFSVTWDFIWDGIVQFVFALCLYSKYSLPGNRVAAIQSFNCLFMYISQSCLHAFTVYNVHVQWISLDSIATLCTLQIHTFDSTATGNTCLPLALFYNSLVNCRFNW